MKNISGPCNIAFLSQPIANESKKGGGADVRNEFQISNEPYTVYIDLNSVYGHVKDLQGSEKKEHKAKH